MTNMKIIIANDTTQSTLLEADRGTTAEHFTSYKSGMGVTLRTGRIQKLFIQIFTLAVICMMCAAFGYRVHAEVIPPVVTDYGLVEVTSLQEFDYVYDNLADYKLNGALVISCNAGQTTLTRNYNFKDVGVQLYDINISSQASVKTTNKLIIAGKYSNNAGTLTAGVVEWNMSGDAECDANTNNGTIICLGMDGVDHDFEIYDERTAADWISEIDFINNGTIILKNTGIICLDSLESKFKSFINSSTGVIENKSIRLLAHKHDVRNTNIYGTVYEGEGVPTTVATTNNGIIRKIPKNIDAPATTGGSDVTLAATTIPAPAYTVTIPKAIAFGDCEKKMANDTEENKIKTITPDALTLIHSNLFVNEKKVTVTMGADFLIKNGESTLAFELYDGKNKLATNTTLLTANPTAADNDAEQTKTLTAKLDQSKIKTSGAYTGTVTFTVAMTDAE